MLIRLKDAYVLSTPDVALNDTIVLYPNPTATTIQINTNTDIEKATIFTLSGKIVKEITNPSKTIPIEYLSSGTYIIKVTTEKRSLVSKFVKL